MTTDSEKKVDEIDILSQVINNEYQILRTLEIVNELIKKTGAKFSQDELDAISETCVRKLQEKYPHGGIALTKEGDENESK